MKTPLVVVVVAGGIAIVVANGDVLEGLRSAGRSPVPDYRVCLSGGPAIVMDYVHLVRGDLPTGTSVSSYGSFAL